jgi:hypothetical protein
MEIAQLVMGTYLKYEKFKKSGNVDEAIKCLYDGCVILFDAAKDGNMSKSNLKTLPAY